MSAESDFQTLHNNVRYGGHRNALLINALLINVLVLLMRPQNNLPVLETIKLPFILSIFPFVLWLPNAAKRWAPQMKWMTVILLFGAIWVPLARNNRWAFEGWRVLAQLFLMILFPLAMSFQGRVWLDKLYKVFLFGATYIAFYGVTHGGVGPGDYLGDENDLCLVLVLFLGLLLGLLSAPQSAFRKMLLFGSVGLIIIAIVVTGSRGGFLGMVTVSGFHVLHARRKVGFFLLAVVLAFLTFILAPKAYWDRISTITKTNEGSALERKETWGFAWDIFTRMDVLPFGVGFKNTPIYLGDYKTSTSRNLWGRQTHSFYMELLPDFGLFGSSIVLLLLYQCFFGNRRYLKRAQRALKELRRRSSGSQEDKLLYRELHYLRSSMISINAAWLGTLVSAAFISILYYPPIWLLIAISVALQGYAQRVMRLADFYLSQNVLPSQKKLPQLTI